MDEKPATHRSIFAIWRWPRWLLIAGIPLLLVLYLLSDAPAIWLVHRKNLLRNIPRAVSVVDALYAPSGWCVENIEICKSIWDMQFEAMERAFGDERID